MKTLTKELKQQVLDYIDARLSSGTNIIYLMSLFKEPVLPDDLGKIELEYEDGVRRFAHLEFTQRLTNTRKKMTNNDADMHLFGLTN